MKSPTSSHEPSCIFENYFLDLNYHDHSHHHSTTTTMSREQYTPPNLTGNAGSSSGAQTGGFNITGSNTYEDTSKPVQYLCGDCDTKVTLKQGDAIRCKECGYRVLYKERTNR
jgi:DNA-directed RNA polymerase subunit RPC12/RpoP